MQIVKTVKCCVCSGLGKETVWVVYIDPKERQVPEYKECWKCKGKGKIQININANK